MPEPTSPPAEGSRPEKRPFYGWIIVGAVFVILTFCSGVTVYSLSIYLHAFIASGRFSIDQVSFASGSFSIAMGIVGALVSALLERLDVRLVIGAGTCLMALALSALPWVDSLPALYGFYIVLGLGYGTAALIPCTTLIARWFDDKRSTAMSISATGNSFGAIALAPPAALLIGEFGLSRSGPWIALALALGVLPLTWLALRAWPSDLGLTPLGAERHAGGSRATATPRWTYQQARETRFFWLTSLAFMLGMAAHIGGQTHLFNLLKWRAVPTGLAGTAIAAMAGASVLARLPAIWLLARMPPRSFAALLLALQALALAGCGLAETPWLLGLCILSFGATLGNLVTVQSLVLAQAFGVVAYPRLYGLSRVVSVLGVLLGPGLMGLLFQVQQAYWGAYLAVGAISLAGLAVILASGATPRAAISAPDRSR